MLQGHLQAPFSEAAPQASSCEWSALPRTREIENLVRSVMATWNGSGPLLQKRRWHRLKFREEVVLTPLDEATGTQAGPPRRAEGHDISLGGISFTHASPLPFRTVAVTLVRADGALESVVTRLTWCRFTRDGYYRSGGRFVRKIELAVQNRGCWHVLPPA